MGSGIRIESLPLLARGGQADIYAYGNDKVLRVPRRAQDYDRIRYEYEVYSSLAGSPVAAPKAYGIVEVDGAPAIVMERISGVSMMDRIRKRPFAIGRKSKELAGMHLELLRLDAGPSIVDGKMKARHCIRGSQFLTAEVMDRLLGVLERLPEGNSLCHSDFHPGNIIDRDGRNYLVDWSAASRGDFVSDIAHTYVLLKVVPRVPGMSLSMHRIQRQLAKVMANVYLKTIAGSRPFHPGTFSRWVLIKAAERTYYGLPSERSRLVSYIGKYMEAMDAGGNEDALYRMI